MPEGHNARVRSEQALAAIEDGSFMPFYDELQGGGYLYKHDLPDEDIARYLDWDAPLSEQGNISAAAYKALDDSPNPDAGYSRLAGNNDVIGNDLYGALEASYGSQQAASEALAKAGIPGLKYYDGMSRGKGGVPVYQGRSKKGLTEFFNPDGVAWGTTDIGTAEQFAGKTELSKYYPSYHGEVYPLNFNIQNPMKVSIKDTLWSRDKELAKIAEAKSKGHDGLVIEHNGKMDYVAFSPDQVSKQGTRNYVTWDQDVLNRMKLLERNGEPVGLLDDRR